MSPDLISSLERLELHLGRELVYNSGYRCPACNKNAGGSSNSAHLRGLAVDIRCVSSADLFELVENAIILGWRRIGIGKSFVHFDVDLTLPQDVIWLY